MLTFCEKIKDLARAEVTKMLEKTGGKLEMADVNSLNYLDRCIKESLRLYPSGPIIGRHITEEVELSELSLNKKSYIAALS